MLGKLQRSPFPKGSLRGGQNRTGQFSLYQTRLDTLVNPKVQVDSTAQENNITFPTDAKLRNRVIDKCNKIAKKEKIVQHQTYKRVSKKLLKDSYFGHHPKRRKSAESARRKLKTIGGRLIRELEGWF